MSNINYSNNLTKALKVFNEICIDQNSKLNFIKEVFETDGAANMNFDLDKLKTIMSLVVPKVLENDTSIIKDHFYKNLDTISKCDTPEDIILLFKSNQEVIDEFCISYLTFKQYIDFIDNEKSRLIKIQNAIAKQVVEYVSGSLNNSL
ncbi:DUF1951 domain-containing protein [Mycoplasmoides pirum]|uniref:DUF1951 domain-containing protein n=1 Tax=Mycoplasmoides pirum TaxID=2122 RepID=UPI000483ADE0|nr:DUF1951 domain-containing protein [Mycoplasmoides pirum]